MKNIYKQHVRLLFCIMIMSMLFCSLQAQTQAIAYQSVLTDAEGDILKNVQAEIMIDVIQGTASGDASYSESHNVTTGSNGEIQLQIGKGTAEFMTFADIDWSQPNYIEMSFMPSGFSNFFSTCDLRASVNSRCLAVICIFILFSLESSV